MKKVLFVRTQNAGRSQTAEAFFDQHAGTIEKAAFPA